MKPLLISSGEPAGVGPDLCLTLAQYEYPVVILGDRTILEQRAKALGTTIVFKEYSFDQPMNYTVGQLYVLSIPCASPVIAGVLQPEHGSYVIELLTKAAFLCGQHHFSALVTAPVHKANINAAGIPFTGHTEFFADFFQVQQVVMMLAYKEMRVALVTTHLPLQKVPAAITASLLTRVIMQLHQSLINDFGINRPLIKVAGLNPHAGESGYLGREELDIIEPTLLELRKQGLNLQGPFPADTMFVKDNEPCDAYVAMYHDQGLPVLKYAGFNQAVNITLGLPIIRTSVDHGTALHLAGTNKVDTGSILMATNIAMTMAITRSTNDNDKFNSSDR